MRTRCACVLEFSKFISVPASRRVFASSAKNPCSFWRQSVGERETQTHSQNFNRSYYPARPPEKHTESTHFHERASTFQPPSSLNAVKRKSHGIPTTQYVHKRESAQLWLAETKGRGQTDRRAPEPHPQKMKPWITECCTKTI